MMMPGRPLPLGVRRRRSTQKLGALQVAGLLLILGLCCGYIYFVSHSPHLSQLDLTNMQDVGFHRSVYRRRMAEQNLHFGGASNGDVLGFFPAARNGDASKLLVASHNRLLWYNYISGAVAVLHKGKGVYYGLFPGLQLNAEGQPTSVWVVSRPHNWHPKTTVEQLIEIDMETGDELQAVTIDSRFTHDVARRGNDVYVCSTEAGAVLQLQLPDLVQKRAMEVFTLKEHVNSVAPLENGSLWLVLHNLGESQLVKLDLKTESVVRRFEGVGTNSHSIVAWRSSLLMLDSKHCGLLRVSPHNGSHITLYTVPDGGKFLKGLAVIDDVAYFGISVWSTRAARGGAASDSELAAFCLRGMELLWRRRVPTHGLLNVVAAPHLAVGSTYQALEPQLPRPKKDQVAASVANSGEMGIHAPSPPSVVRQNRTAAQTLAEFPAVFGGKWASGLPFMDLGLKQQHSSAAGIQLPLVHVDVIPLQAALLAHDEGVWHEAEQRRSNAYFEGRGANMNHFKPGVETIVLLFSDQQGSQVFEFPWYRKFQPLLEPVLQQVLGGEDLAKIIRMQFARMRPGVHIKPHRDGGQWAVAAHRLHIPVTSSPGVGFQVCLQLSSSHQSRGAGHRGGASDGNGNNCWPVSLAEGDVFELNNSLLHSVDNDSNVTRIHLIVDVAEQPHERTALRLGQVCRYESPGVVC